MHTLSMFGCMNTNYHMQRAIELRERENHVARVIAAANRRDSIEWALAIIFVWLLAMGVDVYRTLYAATVQGAGPLAGLSAFIALGLILSAMCFAVWKRNR